MTRLWDKGAPLDERVLAYTAGRGLSRSMSAWCAYDVRASIAHAEMLQAQGLLSPRTSSSIRGGLARAGRGARARPVAHRARG